MARPGAHPVGVVPYRGSASLALEPLAAARRSRGNKLPTCVRTRALLRARCGSRTRGTSGARGNIVAPATATGDTFGRAPAHGDAIATTTGDTFGRAPASGGTVAPATTSGEAGADPNQATRRARTSADQASRAPGPPPPTGLAAGRTRPPACEGGRISPRRSRTDYSAVTACRHGDQPAADLPTIRATAWRSGQRDASRQRVREGNAHRSGPGRDQRPPKP
jgi:hypothetical protein